MSENGLWEFVTSHGGEFDGANFERAKALRDSQGAASWLFEVCGRMQDLAMQMEVEHWMEVVDVKTAELLTALKPGYSQLLGLAWVAKQIEERKRQNG